MCRGRGWRHQHGIPKCVRRCRFLLLLFRFWRWLLSRCFHCSSKRRTITAFHGSCIRIEQTFLRRSRSRSRLLDRHPLVLFVLVHRSTRHRELHAQRRVLLLPLRKTRHRNLLGVLQSNEHNATSARLNFFTDDVTVAKRTLMRMAISMLVGSLTAKGWLMNTGSSVVVPGGSGSSSSLM